MQRWNRKVHLRFRNTRFVPLYDEMMSKTSWWQEIDAIPFAVDSLSSISPVYNNKKGSEEHAILMIQLYNSYKGLNRRNNWAITIYGWDDADYHFMTNIKFYWCVSTGSVANQILSNNFPSIVRNIIQETKGKAQRWSSRQFTTRINLRKLFKRTDIHTFCSLRHLSNPIRIICSK